MRVKWDHSETNQDNLLLFFIYIFINNHFSYNIQEKLEYEQGFYKMDMLNIFLDANKSYNSLMSYSLDY